MEIICENIWASDFTKINVLAKVAGMRQLVGYPDWLTNGTKVDKRVRKGRLPSATSDPNANAAGALLQYTKLYFSAAVSQLQLGKNRVESLANFVH